jgi:hypothetical protein
MKCVHVHPPKEWSFRQTGLGGTGAQAPIERMEPRCGVSSNADGMVLPYRENTRTI